MSDFAAGNSPKWYRARPIGAAATRLSPPTRAPAWLLLLLVLVAVATRWQQYGNPIIHIDEQFYLLVGDRMLRGALPYVDIWDRKPIGLFLIYAAIRLLGGSGILQYQLVATGFAVATAWLIHRIASRIAGQRGATLSAVLYLLWIPLLTGQGGQAPVFYNLFVAAAALCVLRIEEAPRSTARIGGLGALAMACIGIAIQIKYNALFEGFYFGLALLWLGWRGGVGLPALTGLATGWVLVALTPTIAAGLSYWAMGDLRAFWFANFVSIFDRSSIGQHEWHNAASLSLYVAPLMVLAAAGAKRRRRAKASHDGGFVTGWFIAALASVIAFRYYFDHYGLPLVAPAAVSAATFLDDPRRRRWSALVLAGACIACLLVPVLNQRRRGTPAQFAALVALTKPYAARGLFVTDRYPILYHVLDAPLPTRYVFPTHLFSLNEAGATGVGQVAEIERVMDNHPAVVTFERSKPGTVLLPPTQALLRRLAADYRLAGIVPVGRRDQLVFVLKGVAPAP